MDRKGANESLSTDQDNEFIRPASFHAMNYPSVDDPDMSFLYDTTFSDYPFDFLSGSMSSYSRIAPLEGFGSVDNLSLDDFY